MVVTAIATSAWQSAGGQRLAASRRPSPTSTSHPIHVGRNGDGMRDRVERPDGPRHCPSTRQSSCVSACSRCCTLSPYAQAVFEQSHPHPMLVCPLLVHCELYESVQSPQHLHIGSVPNCRTPHRLLTSPRPSNRMAHNEHWPKPQTRRRTPTIRPTPTTKTTTILRGAEEAWSSTERPFVAQGRAWTSSSTDA